MQSFVLFVGLSILQKNFSQNCGRSVLGPTARLVCIVLITLLANRLCVFLQVASIVTIAGVVVKLGSQFSCIGGGGGGGGDPESRCSSKLFLISRQRVSTDLVGSYTCKEIITFYMHQSILLGQLLPLILQG